MINENKLHWILLVSFALSLMAGCSTANKKPDSVIEQEVFELPLPSIGNEEQVLVVPPPAREKYMSSPVVQALLEKSKHKFDAKEFEAAANYIERGINISPDDPMLWQRLAAIRFEQGNFKQAKQLAAKSNILVEENKDLRAINEAIINQANRLLTQ